MPAITSISLPRLTVRRSTALPCSLMPCILNMFFAKSIPTVLIFMMTPPLVIGMTAHHFQSGTFDASRVGGVHFIR